MKQEDDPQALLTQELNRLRQRVSELEALALEHHQMQTALQVSEQRYEAAIAELKRQNSRSQLFAEVTLKIRRSLHLQEILQTAVAEVQQFLHCDRVLIFRFRPDGSGRVVEETVVADWPMILGQDIEDPCFRDHYIELYRRGRVNAIPNVSLAAIDQCHRNLLQQFAVQANLVVPILLKEADLWGLLIAHHCRHPRIWTDFETELLRQLADQMGIALAQAELLQREVQQRQELARSNAELQDFAYVASHDLQEPLRKIQAFGDRLQSRCADVLPEQGQDYLKRMQSAAGRMQTLIRDLLALSQVTTKGRPFVATDLNQVVKDVISDLEVRLRETGGEIQVEPLPTIDADPVQMRQLLQNLIGNALKFHQPKSVPQVRVSATLKEPDLGIPGQVIPQCQLEVADNGIGFDEKYLDRIFQPFQRLHGREEYEGTGIGLGICRKIVERHGGRITATSQPDQGSTFSVTLPLKQQQGALSA